MSKQTKIVKIYLHKIARFYKRRDVVYNMEDSLLHYKKLLLLLEEDYECMKQGLQGEILVEYRDIVRLEIEELKDIMKEFLLLNNFL